MQPTNRFVLGYGTLLSVVMLCSLLLMSEATQNSQRFGNLYVPLLIVNAVGLTLLLALIIYNVHHLLRRVMAEAAGARLTLRMVALTAVLVIVPVGLVYYFSIGFLRQGIDNWFDLEVEQALEDSLELSRLAIDVRTRELLRESRNLAADVAALPVDAVAVEIDALRERSGAAELTLLSRHGEILAASSEDPGELLPRRFEDSMWLQLRKEHSYIAIEESGEAGGLYIRLAVNVPTAEIEEGERVLQLLFPAPERINALASSIQAAFTDYKKLAFIRTQLKDSFVMTLTVVLLFALFSGIWAVFFTAERLVTPLSDLARGTRRVSAGDYHTRLPVPAGKDELGFLVASFNEMTRNIGIAREDAEQSRHRAEAQHAYLKTVLEHVSSGVLVFDAESRLRVFNACAGQVLGVTLEERDSGHSLDELAVRDARFRILARALEPHLGKRGGEWREQLHWLGASGRRIINCSGVHLDEDGARLPGHVIVLEDITELLQSQRDAAWGEVARRLAHEIKNPLTPIQLSAERLRHKYLGHGHNSAEDATLNRLTNTIIGQVQTMKGMVDSFTDYASPPAPELTPTDLNRLIRETVELYKDVKSGTEFELALQELPLTHADTCRLRQVFNNLVGNSIDACQEGRAHLCIHSRLCQGKEGDYIRISISDTGPGLPAEVRERVFEPYVTTKCKGTGLGLAIVRRIIEDHGGTVHLADRDPPPGAQAVIELPVRTAGIAGETAA